MNVEHLLNVFTSIDANSDDIWDACASFMEHLYWHKIRLVVLGSKLEGLPDNHPSKPKCLFHLSRLFDSVGNHAERKRLLTHTLKLWREGEEGDTDLEVAQTLMFLAHTNHRLLLHKEGILQAKESLEIFERLNDVLGQAQCLQDIAQLLQSDNQLDAAEEAASRSIDLLPKSQQFEVCQGHCILGGIFRSKGEADKAISQYKTALGIASSFEWHGQQYVAHFSLAELFSRQGRFDDAHAHVECAKPHADNDAYHLGRAIELQARIWCQQDRLEEAKSEVLCAVGVFEKLGAAEELERCRKFLQWIEEEMSELIASDESDFDGELLETLPLPPSSAREPSVDSFYNHVDHSRRILPRTANSTPS